MRRFLVLMILVLAAVTGAGSASRAQVARPVMVVAANPKAVDAGLEILRHGGSALDAAIAVQMVLAVVEPQASGLGGGGFLLYYDRAQGRITAYDGRETAPHGATPELFLDPDGKPLAFPEAVLGGASVGVPGLLRMLAMAHARHGRLEWAQLFAPAIALAESGFEVPPRLGRALAQERALQRSEEARAIYFSPGGEPRRIGERITNPPLAATLRTVMSEGAAAFYSGPIAEDIVRAVSGARRPGSLSLDDLAKYRPVVREAVCGTYRQWRLCGMPPPSSGPLAVLQALGMLERFDLARDKPNSLRSVHLIAEASRLAFADRARFVGDPDFVRVPAQAMLDPAYLAQRSALIDEERSMRHAEPGTPVPDLNYRHDEGPSEIPATSHMVIVDAAGNVVTFTTTIEAVFGSRLFVRGMLLNNELTDFSFAPRQGERLLANRVEAGKRPRSSMAPMLAFDRSGELVLAIGSAGGSRIIGDVLQATIGVLDWNLSMQEAVALPRVSNQNAATEIENIAPLNALAEPLRVLGHAVELRAHEGGLAGIRWVDGAPQGGADPRRDGVARGN